MRKFIAAATIAAALAVPAVSSAATTNNASCQGATHGAFANVNSNFGWLGQDGGASDNGTQTGQTPGAVGYNNSHVICS
jgi:hypothetical protein